MVRIGNSYGKGHYVGEVVCERCGTTAEVDLWSVEPLNYATPFGWSDVQVQGNLYGHLCPDCTAQARAEALMEPSFLNSTVGTHSHETTIVF